MKLVQNEIKNYKSFKFTELVSRYKMLGQGLDLHYKVVGIKVSVRLALVKLVEEQLSLDVFKI